MDKAARKRWTILATMFLLTVVAIFYPVDEESSAVARVAVSPDKRAAVPSGPPLVSVPALTDDLDADPEADPFAPHGWSQSAPAPLPSPAKSADAEVVAQAAPELPAGPPPLPFQFVGSMNDGADQVVYLGRGDQALLARTGAVLEGTYKVSAILAHQIEFEHLPSGQKQTLVFPVRDN